MNEFEDWNDMGMFDEFRDMDGRLTCAAGHKPTGWQTKAFEREMTTYFLYQGKLFVQDHEDKRDFYLDAQGDLRQPRERVAVPVLRTAEIAVYTHCAECEPVLHTGGNSWSSCISERQPWCEYRLVFVRGELDEVRPYRLETRDEEALREVQSRGGKVLDDDSPVALVYKQARKGKMS